MQVSNLTKDQWVKVVKTLAYVAASAIIGSLIAQVQDRPDLFGLYTPIINVVLVTLKQAFTEGEK